MAKVLPANAAHAFLDALEASQILNAEALAKIREQFAAAEDPKIVARDLIKEGKITRWQAQQLLGGFTALVVGNYKMLEQLGVGEMGRVFLAEHLQMQRKVALKILARKHTSQPQMLRRLLAEARRVAAIEHPNISHIQDVNQDGERYFLVLEYVDAQDLQRQVQATGKLPAAQAWNVIRQTAEGLAHAHSQGIVHGGLKPSNLLLDKQSNVKILDFGLAQLAAATDVDSADSVEQAAVTAKLFRAPETGKQPADRLGDVYSLGATLYFLLTGKPPTNGPASTADLVKEAPATTNEMLELCTKLMSANPGDRPQDDQTLIASIEAAKPAGTAAKAAPKAAVPAAKPAAPAIKTATALPTAKALPTAAAEEPVVAKAPPPKAKKPVVAKALPSVSDSQPVPAIAAEIPAPETTPQPAAEEPAGDDNPFAGFAVKTKGKKTESSGAMPAISAAAPKSAKAPPAKPAPAKTAATEAAAAEPAPVTPAKKGKKGKAAGNNMPLILAGGIGGGVLVLGTIIGLVIYLTSGGDGKQVAKVDPDQPATASKEPGASAGEANPATEANPTVEANPVVPVEANPVVPKVEANPKPAVPMPMSTATPAVDPATPKPELTPEPAKPEPPMVAAVTPEKKPDPPPTPKPVPKPVAVGNPFVGFGKAVTLPKLPAGMSEPTPEMLAAMVIGPCKVPDENTVISAVLKGGETAYSKGKMKFTMESANGGTSLRDWDFKVSGGLVETPVVIATMSAKNDQLLFQWTAEAAKQAAAPYLCNCVIMLSAGTGKVELALREPVAVEPILIGIEKRNLPAKFNLDLPPEPKQLMFEITGVEGDVPKVKYDSKELVAEKGTTFFWVGNVETETPLGIKVDTSITNGGKTVQVITLPQFKLEGMTRPSMYAKKELQTLSQNIESELQIGGAMIQQAAAVPDAKKKGELSQAGTLRLEPAQKAKAQFEQLQTLAKGLQASGKIKFRIYANAEDSKVELVNSSGAVAAPQPAAPAPEAKAPAAKLPAKAAANDGAAANAVPQPKARAGAPKAAPVARAPIGTQEATAEQIASESRQLEEFDTKFKGKPFRITGMVESLTGEVVRLQGGVTMTFAKKGDVAGVAKGGQVVIDGEYQQRGPDGPMFSNCDLVSK